MLLHTDLTIEVAHERDHDWHRTAKLHRLAAQTHQPRQTVRRQLAARLAHLLENLSARLLQYAQRDQSGALASAPKPGRAS